MYKYIKRFLDILFSLMVIIIFFIPALIISIAIKIEDGGPVLFKQKRTGKKGCVFDLYKFRSMSIDNDVLNFKEEDKITKIGKFLRKTSLDEIPQVINIIKGDMSFVGPRPWIVKYYENFTEEQKRRVDVKPGLTGLAQAKGRNNLNIFEKINYDIEYVNNQSFVMDVKVVILTIKAIITRNGAKSSKFGIKDDINALHVNLEKEQKSKEKKNSLVNA